MEILELLNALESMDAVELLTEWLADDATLDEMDAFAEMVKKALAHRRFKESLK